MYLGGLDYINIQICISTQSKTDVLQGDSEPTSRSVFTHKSSGTGQGFMKCESNIKYTKARN
jgi:hypothetical protein